MLLALRWALDLKENREILVYEPIKKRETLTNHNSEAIQVTLLSASIGLQKDCYRLSFTDRIL